MGEICYSDSVRDGLTDRYDRLFFVYGSPKAVGAGNNSPPEQYVAQRSFVEGELRETYPMTSFCVEVVDCLFTSTQLSVARHVTIGGAYGPVGLGGT